MLSVWFVSFGSWQVFNTKPFGLVLTFFWPGAMDRPWRRRAVQGSGISSRHADSRSRSATPCLVHSRTSSRCSRSRSRSAMPVVHPQPHQPSCPPPAAMLAERDNTVTFSIHMTVNPMGPIAEILRQLGMHLIASASTGNFGAGTEDLDTAQTHNLSTSVFIGGQVVQLTPDEYVTTEHVSVTIQPWAINSTDIPRLLRPKKALMLDDLKWFGFQFGSQILDNPFDLQHNNNNK